jgi:prophage regulatory protein
MTFLNLGAYIMNTLSNNIPDDAWLRLPHIVGDKKQGIAPLLPVSRSTWLNGVRDEIYPKGTLISKRLRAWRGKDVKAVLAKMSQAVESQLDAA